MPPSNRINPEGKAKSSVKTWTAVTIASCQGSDVTQTSMTTKVVWGSLVGGSVVIVSEYLRASLCRDERQGSEWGDHMDPNPVLLLPAGRPWRAGRFPEPRSPATRG